jgi:outer membrane scaffolding protein for murein synthesis (MipA/OmpV family)
MQTYFGINGTQSINSGYPVYNASSGIKNVGLEVRANYQFSSNWLFSASTQVSRLAGNAAGSPISVSDTAVTLITTIGYRF